MLVRKDIQYIHTNNTTFPSDLSSQQQTNKKQQTKQTNDKQEHQEWLTTSLDFRPKQGLPTNWGQTKLQLPKCN
jgi:hypothetical protein